MNVNANALNQEIYDIYVEELKKGGEYVSS